MWVTPVTAIAVLLACAACLSPATAPPVPTPDLEATVAAIVATQVVKSVSTPTPVPTPRTATPTPSTWAHPWLGYSLRLPPGSRFFSERTEPGWDIYEVSGGGTTVVHVPPGRSGADVHLSAWARPVLESRRKDVHITIRREEGVGCSSDLRPWADFQRDRWASFGLSDVYRRMSYNQARIRGLPAYEAVFHVYRGPSRDDFRLTATEVEIYLMSGSDGFVLAGEAFLFPAEDPPERAVEFLESILFTFDPGPVRPCR